MSPPEIVAATFETGPGPASVLANQLVWVTEAISHELMVALSAANAGATATQWIGGGGIASLTNSFGLNTGLQTMIGWIAHKIAVTQAAVDAFILARSSVIPSLVAQTNRDEWAALVATNAPLGQNTGAIIERDSEYFGDYWPQNSSIGFTYASSLNMLTGTLGMPPPPSPMGASPGAPIAAAESAGESAARSAAGGLTESMGTAAEAPSQLVSSGGGAGNEMASLLQQGPQLFSGLAEQAQSLTSAPTMFLQSAGSLPQTFLGSLSSFGGGAFNPTSLTSAVGEPMPTMATAVNPGAGAGVIGGGGGYPASLTSYTKPSSTFSPEVGGRPTGRAGALNATELRPVTTTATGGTPMPMSPAGSGMLGRSGEGNDQNEGVRARIMVGPQGPDSDGGTET